MLSHKMVFTYQASSQLLHATMAIKKSKVGQQELVRVMENGMDIVKNAKKVIYNFINIGLCLPNANKFLLVSNKIHYRHVFNN